ncbi:DUF397 domain-containing protein [Actinomadura sp. 9N215]|uniref:DUF397 domain-containing protein n=1 Tax=Actinomadura sp. 9N215 TaxID=3375150 RepID=UPI0037AE018F
MRSADVRWRKSSRSGGQGGNCVEVAGMASAVAVRDSKDPDGPRLAFGMTEWRIFTHRVKSSDLNSRK